ncbi:YdeI/OmpD-associated family protein [Variovorax soli]|uniref:YdeI/OmpD-associated family protein n=1 Tax=Variovorax soli TaxID=376815 RepID=UPI000838F8E9|nr:YdeI/OmpD-associated family protein [Variovorax soli]
MSTRRPDSQAPAFAESETLAGLPILPFADAAAWRRWLARHGGKEKGLWLKLAKKGNPAPSVGRAEAIEEALCHGWIDGQLQGYDDLWWLVRFTPRQARSKWSQVNCRTALRLIDEGRLQPAGLAQVEAAKADGRWEAAYASQSEATVPPDLQAALDANQAAAQFFAKLNGANRFAILYRVQEPKLPATRARRIEQLVAMLARGETIHLMPEKKKREAAGRGEDDLK